MEAVNLKRTPSVTRKYVEVLNRCQWKTRSSSTAVKNSNVRQRLDTRSVYKVTRCRCIATALSVPLQGFLRKFGTLDWILWSVHLASLLRRVPGELRRECLWPTYFTAGGYLYE